MKKIFIILFAFSCSLWSDVLLIEDDIVNFSVAPECRKLPTSKTDILLYVDQEDRPAVIVQLFRKNSWSDWHMRGLKKSKKTFQKFFDTELGGGHGEKLLEVAYDEKRNELTLEWQQKDGSKLLSRMKLTSFGCIAIHVPFTENTEKESALNTLEYTVNSLQIPDKYKFVPGSMFEDLSSNIGGGFFFIVLSLAYLMFSLFKRSQLHQLKLERRLRDVKASQVQYRPH